MADELQGLLDRIRAEGVQKAAAERQKILAEAKAEATRLLAAARAEADALRQAAREDADATLAKGQDTLRQAARDLVLSLRQQLQDRLRQVVTAGVGEALQPQALAGLLGQLIEGYLGQAEGTTQVEVLLPADARAAVEASFLRRLSDDLRARTELTPVAGVQRGFKLVFNGADVVWDFSDAALAEALCTFLNPKLAELVRPAP